MTALLDAASPDERPMLEAAIGRTEAKMVEYPAWMREEAV